jgi:hypothetical protein
MEFRIHRVVTVLGTLDNGALTLGNLNCTAVGYERALVKRGVAAERLPGTGRCMG